MLARSLRGAPSPHLEVQYAQTDADFALFKVAGQCSAWPAQGYSHRPPRGPRTVAPRRPADWEHHAPVGGAGACLRGQSCRPEGCAIATSGGASPVWGCVVGSWRRATYCSARCTRPLAGGPHGGPPEGSHSPAHSARGLFPHTCLGWRADARLVGGHDTRGDVVSTAWWVLHCAHA